MNATHFRDLDVWRVAMELTRRIYELVAGFPKEERYGLTAQLQRAAVSIPSNVAEGNARQSVREYARFVSIASGSVAEVQTQLLLTIELGLADQGSVDPVLDLAERVSKMLYRLRQSLERNANCGSRVPGPGSRTASPGSRVSEDFEEYL
ncbi:MAG: four helix bundle protein [Rhodanobacteraceae bacterium]